MIVYLYDATGAPIGMMYRTTSYAEGAFDVFWFEKNLHGDIVAIYDESGTKIATYTYTDAWGNHSVSYTNGGASTGAQYNPFRYRSYYYDTDLGLYYLQSRYYDAKICRFINADSALYHSMLGYNMFAYCGNNPVNYFDPTGEYSEALNPSWIDTIWLALLALIDGPLPIGEILGAVIGTLIVADALRAAQNKTPEKTKDKPNDPPSSVTEPNDSSSKDKNGTKDSDLTGKPGEVKHNGNKDTHIGKNGKADQQRHNTTHGKPKYHTAPHDHDITWDTNGNPVFSDPINYWDGNVPIFPRR